MPFSPGPRMNAAAYSAGWRTDDEPDTGPAPCAGTGQLVAAWSAAGIPACPVCGRRVRPDPYTAALPTHYPDPDGAPPLSLWKD